MESKTIFRIVKITFLISLVTFLALYTSKSVGYFEYQNNRKVSLTNKQIEKFEEDVKNGKQIDLEDYIETTPSDYQNKISKFGLKISNVCQNVVEKVVTKTFKILSKLGE